jgi:methyltransferase (TIGR00027 family)
MNPISLTSCWVAVGRALETERPDRLFHDPYARALAGPQGFALFAAMQAAKGGTPSAEADPYLSIRTRFFDDALLRALADPALRQLVLLGAGMDARAFRLRWPPGARLFELDRQEVFDHKDAVLAGLGARPACTRHTVAVDLEGDWPARLGRAGFDPEAPAAFLLEGLLVYLEPAAALGLLEKLSPLARPGSWLGADLVGPELLASPYIKPFLDLLTQRGCPWRFGVSDPVALLAPYGWAADFVLPGEPEAHYGRWPYPVAPRSVPGFPRSYLVTARRADRSDKPGRLTSSSW